MDITLGLDFGTHQSKLCLSYMPNNDSIHEFVEFKTPEGGFTTLFPSVIQINEDDTISVGFVDENRCKGVKAPKPAQPELPKEPSLALPAEPKKTYPKKPKAVELDWKDKLLAVAKGVDKNQQALDEWSRACARIDAEHAREMMIWRQKCETIKAEHRKWQDEVDSIMADYAETVAIWEKNNERRQYYRYFKLSSFSAQYPWDSENLISADTLSVWYLTYLMLYVKKQVAEKFDEVFEESVAVQMGVPSGVNTRLSKQIKYHAFKLLIAARQMMENFNSPEELCSMKYQDLLELTVIPTSNIVETADDYGFFVMPEAFAGLQSLTNRKRLTRGKMHILVDIGGGTTDIAFFTITEDLSPNVHTVHSFHKGLNYVFESFCKEHKGYSMVEAQKLFMRDRSQFSKGLSAYRKELSVEIENLVDMVKREFQHQMISARISVDRLTDAMQGCPIVYCGGGSVYSQMRVKAKYFSDERLVDKNTLSIPNLKNRTLNDEHYTILATSYGLSVPQFEDPAMKDLTELFQRIAENAAGGLHDTHSRFEYGLTDD